MRCTDVEKSDLIERYLAHELSQQEEDEFEAHYFQCEHCAHEVYLMQNIVHQAKEISFAGEKATMPESVNTKSKLWHQLIEQIDIFIQPLARPLAVGFAAIFLLLIVGGIKYIDLKNQVQQLQQPRINSVYVSLFPEGAIKNTAQNVNIVKLPRYAEAVTLEFNVDDVETYDQFIAKILDKNNNVIWQNDDLKAIGLYKTFSLVAPKKFFQQGDYILTVSGLSNGEETKLQKFPFRIMFE